MKIYKPDLLPVSLKQFVEAVRKVLLSDGHAEYENRKPTEAERKEKWRLDSR